MDTSGLGGAYHAGDHYENFPVGSWLIPEAIRPAVIALYRFARAADDWADEGQIPAAERLDALNAMRAELERAAAGDDPRDRDHQKPPSGPSAVSIPSGPATALAEALRQRGLPDQPAHALLDAFTQDVVFAPMVDEAAVLDYCSRSANPVGRLMLALTGIASLKPETETPQSRIMLTESDAICTGLQLANFAQDLGQDISRGRVYIPKTWWPEGWAPTQGVQGLSQEQRDDIARRMAQWAKIQLDQGCHLPLRIRRFSNPAAPGRLRFAIEIGLTLEGGRAIVAQVLKDPAAVWISSPRIPRSQMPLLAIRGLIAAFKARTMS